MSKIRKPSAASAKPTTKLTAELQALRAQRIHDYLKSALAQRDPLLANLGAVHSDLLQVEQKLKQALDQALSDKTRDMLDLEVLLPVLDHLLRLAKQIDRFSQLELKLKSTECKLSASQGHPAQLRDTPAARAERPPSSEEPTF